MIHAPITYAKLGELPLQTCVSIRELELADEAIFTLDPEHFAHPAPAVIKAPDALAVNACLSRATYDTPNYQIAKIKGLYWAKYCNVPFTSDLRLIEDAFPGNRTDFSAWPFNYLPHSGSGPDYRLSFDDKAVVQIDQDVVIGVHSSGGVFGHFVLDTLTIAYTFREQLISGSLRLALFTPSTWSIDLICALGVPRRSILVLHDRVVRFKSAIVTSSLSASTTYSPNSLVRNMFDGLRRRTLTYGGTAKLKLFLMRGGAKSRLANEVELAARFVGAGYLALQPDTLPMNTQLEMCVNATHIASSFGSSLALAPIMSDEGAVIEIIPSDVDDAWFVRLMGLTGKKHTAVVVNGRKSERSELNCDWLLHELTSRGLL